tara:strand:- start:427 stop:624 length:198 start_codon:yes stop_codon:yes gene_type:complete
MSDFSESAITLGRIQTEFDCLYGTKEMRERLSLSERTSELLRICNRDGVSYKGFTYLERKLLGGK